MWKNKCILALTDWCGLLICRKKAGPIPQGAHIPPCRFTGFAAVLLWMHTWISHSLFIDRMLLRYDDWIKMYNILLFYMHCFQRRIVRLDRHVIFGPSLLDIYCYAADGTLVLSKRSISYFFIVKNWSKLHFLICSINDFLLLLFLKHRASFPIKPSAWLCCKRGDRRLGGERS